MDEAPLDEGEARGLRFLRRLVTLLTVVMIGGVLAIVALLVIRLQAPAPGPRALPEALALPAGAEAAAVTMARDRILVLTTDDRVLLYDLAGVLLGETVLAPAD